MTPNKEYDQWLRKYLGANQRLTETNKIWTRHAFLHAWKLALKQGMEEAAKICDATVKQAYDEGEGSTDIPAWISNCAKAIREVKDKL